MSSVPRSGTSLPVALTLAALASVVFSSGPTRAEDETGWAGELNIALSNQTGTTDTFQGSLDAKLSREWEVDKLSLRGRGAYGRTLDRGQSPPNSQTPDITQNSQSLGLAWQRQFNDRYFWNTETTGSRDTVQEVNFRYVFDSGPGYRLWKGDEPSKRHLDINAAVGYRLVQYRGDEDDLNLVDLIAGFDYKNLVFDDRLEISHTGKILLPANEIDAWAVNTEIIFGVPITASWSMRVGFEFDYQNFTPPRVNKIKTVTSMGLGYKF